MLMAIMNRGGGGEADLAWSAHTHTRSREIETLNTMKAVDEHR